VPHVAAIAVGEDRPGIVASVCEVLLGHGANLEDTSMTILRGHFAMMLVVAVPEGTDPDRLQGDVAAAVPDLVVTVRALPEDVTAAPAGPRWAVSVYGADHPGIVYRVTRLLADRGANVVDLSTRVIGPADRPVYAMLLEVTLPAGADAEGLASSLRALGRDLGVECTVHPADADIL
jgi:glycine cleavage system transcriptional repressor